jgi:hypothetical protein
MKADSQTDILRHLSEAELDQAISNAQTADETRLVRRLCFVKNLYAGDTREEAGRCVGVSQPPVAVGRTRGITLALTVCARVSGAGGPRNSQMNSSSSCVRSSKTASRERRERSTCLSKTDMASPTTRRT